MSGLNQLSTSNSKRGQRVECVYGLALAQVNHTLFTPSLTVPFIVFSAYILLTLTIVVTATISY